MKSNLENRWTKVLIPKRSTKKCQYHTNFVIAWTEHRLQCTANISHLKKASSSQLQISFDHLEFVDFQYFLLPQHVPLPCIMQFSVSQISVFQINNSNINQLQSQASIGEGEGREEGKQREKSRHERVHTQ